MRQKWFPRWVGILALCGGVFVAGALGFLLTPAQVLPNVAVQLTSTASVRFERTEHWLAYWPITRTPTTGLIFVPGGRVPAEAYLPVLRPLAEQGYAVFVVPVAFNLAFFDPDAPQAVVDAHPTITQWVLAGHSLGGVVAGNYAAAHLDKVKGLALWASFPQNDLSATGLAVVSVYGALETSRDAFISADTRAKLPPDTRFVEIAGGNHEQFGLYTGQPNDPPATVSREAQQAQAVQATLALLAALP